MNAFKARCVIEGRAFFKPKAFWYGIWLLFQLLALFFCLILFCSQRHHKKTHGTYNRKKQLWMVKESNESIGKHEKWRVKVVLWLTILKCANMTGVINKAWKRIKEMYTDWNKRSEWIIPQSRWEKKWRCKKMKLLSRGGGNFEKRRNTLLGNVVRYKHTKFEEDRSIFTLSNCGGTQKLSKFMGEGEDFFPNFEKRRNTLLGNAVRNKHTKFEQDRSTGSVLKIGGNFM